MMALRWWLKPKPGLSNSATFGNRRHEPAASGGVRGRRGSAITDRHLLMKILRITLATSAALFGIGLASMVAGVHGGLDRVWSWWRYGA